MKRASDSTSSEIPNKKKRQRYRTNAQKKVSRERREAQEKEADQADEDGDQPFNRDRSLDESRPFDTNGRGQYQRKSFLN